MRAGNRLVVKTNDVMLFVAQVEKPASFAKEWVVFVFLHVLYKRWC